MNAMSVEDLFQEIGREAVTVAGDDRAGKLLVYADVEEGVISTNLLYKNRQGNVRLVLGPRPLDDLVYELWQRWKEQPGNEPWRVMSYLVDMDGKLAIDLTYPEDVDEQDDYRRDKAVKKYFGDVKLVFDDPFA